MSELEIHDPFLIPEPDEIEHQIRRPRWWYASQLRMAGASWDEIAQALGYESGASANSAVRSSKRKRDKAEMEDLLDLELDRLDALQLFAWRLAQNGDSKSIQTVLAVMTLRMKLLGLEKRPDSAESVTNNAAIFIGGSEADYTDALKKARDMVFNKAKEIEG